jgi:hypothetical protein
MAQITANYIYVYTQGLFDWARLVRSAFSSHRSRDDDFSAWFTIGPNRTDLASIIYGAIISLIFNSSAIHAGFSACILL